MIQQRVPHRGDIYRIHQSVKLGRRASEDQHRYLVITPKEINVLGIAMTVPILEAEKLYRKTGLTVPIMGHETVGMAVCNQVRPFDIESRVRTGHAHYVETIDKATVSEIIHRVISIIEPSDYAS